MEDFIKPIADFLLEIFKAVLGNVIADRHWNLNWLLFIIFMPLILMYGIVIGNILVKKIFNKIKEKNNRNKKQKTQ